MCMCMCSLVIWVGGALGNLSTHVVLRLHCSHHCFQLHYFSRARRLETTDSEADGFFLLNTPLQPLVFAVVVHIIQPEISARSYCNICAILDQTNITFCFPVSLWSKNRILINVLVELNLYKNKLALNSERLANRIIGSALLMLWVSKSCENWITFLSIFNQVDLDENLLDLISF